MVAGDGFEPSGGIGCRGNIRVKVAEEQQFHVGTLGFPANMVKRAVFRLPADQIRYLTVPHIHRIKTHGQAFDAFMNDQA